MSSNSSKSRMPGVKSDTAIPLKKTRVNPFEPPPPPEPKSEDYLRTKARIVKGATPQELEWSAGQFCPVDITKNDEVLRPFRKPNEKTIAKKEDAFACVCLEHPVFVEFSSEILFKILKKALDTRCLSESKMIEIMLPIKTPENPRQVPSTLIAKPGIENPKLLIELVKQNNYADFKANTTNLHLNMGALYDFTINADFIMSSISDKIKHIIETRARDLFCCGSLTFDEIKHIVTTSSESGKNKRFFLDILAYALGDQSFYRSNLLNNDYIRSKFKKPHWVNPSNTCHSKIVPPGMHLQTGNTYYQVNDESLYAILMKKYNRPYIAGPSGSTILLYNFLFKVVGIEETPSNKAKMLGFVLADYIPYFHTLTEILMSFSVEIEEKYDISEDPVDWCIDYFRRNDIEIKFDLKSTGQKKKKKNTKKRKKKKKTRSKKK